MTLSPENKAAFERVWAAERTAGRRSFDRALETLLNDVRSKEAAKAAKMREALRPFARAGAAIPDFWTDETPAIRFRPDRVNFILTVGDFRRARQAALEPQPIAEGLAGEVGKREPDSRRCDCFANGVSPEMCPHWRRT